MSCDRVDERALARVTSPLSTAVTALLCMWLFGNLYEQVVWNPQLLADPRPGSVPGVFEAGSAVFYYLPWAPLCLALFVVLRVRHHRQAPRRVRRAWNAALGCFAVALTVKIGLITQVNPIFRDPAASRDLVHDKAVLWAFGNGIAVVAVAAAVVLLTYWRRPDQMPLLSDRTLFRHHPRGRRTASSGLASPRSGTAGVRHRHKHQA